MRSMARSVTVVWVVLMTATITTTWLLSKDAFTAEVCTISTVAIASLKVRWIILDFMELRSAPLPGRVVFELWSFAAPAMILGFYLASR